MTDASNRPATLGGEPPPAILIVDDEPNNLTSLEKIFAKEGMRVLTADGAKRALELLRTHHVHVVLTDLMMPGPNGVELLKAVKEVSQNTQVVLMTAYGTVETAVTAMREGAYDFVEKPLKRATIVRSVKKALEHGLLVEENHQLKAEIRALTHREIVGQSAALRAVLETAAHAAPSMANVLVLGESGTGKELIARYVHSRSGRARGPFIAVNCSAIPESILEAELFGYERGAFTGATSRKEGRFDRARGGTIFLDEIGELTPAVQVKLLRVLQEGEFEPLGGRTVKSDVRLVSATNRDLAAEVEAGRFREDLYYRLNVIALTAPPLRSRREDVPLLVDHFLGLYCSKNGRPRLQLTEEVSERLKDYSWPGNVRELENAMERAAVLCRGSEITLSDLPAAIANAPKPEPDRLTFGVGTPLAEVEQRLIQETLRHAGGDKSLAAQLLGISARTIYRKLDEAR
jgi:DNA-binding NtrC family response regulator